MWCANGRGEPAAALWIVTDPTLNLIERVRPRSVATLAAEA